MAGRAGWVWSIAFAFLCGGMVWAQENDVTNPPLGDVVRQNRLQKSRSAGESSKAQSPGEPGEDSTAAPSGASQESLPELARKTRQAARAKAQAALDDAEGATPAPPGYQAFLLRYCQNPQQCSEAPVVIPEHAEMLSRTNGQYIFKAALDGEAIILYAGPADVNAPYRSLTDPDYIRMRDVANSNGRSHEPAEVVSTQQMIIESRASLLTRFRYQRDQKRWWMGERLLIENRGAQFLLGCTAPEDHFAHAEALCTALVDSLRLP